MSRRALGLVWLLAPLPLLLPYLWFSHVYFYGSTDALFYVNILSLTSDALAQGHLFPRWFPAANDGHGSPVMLFYAPLGYTISALLGFPLRLLGASVETQFMFGIYASQVCSGAAAWAWLRRSYSSRAALAGSLLFVLLPYKLVYIYGHCNLAQLWALAFLPLWMLGAEELARGKAKGAGIYALAMAAVFYSHPLTVIAFGAVPACYVLWFGRSRIVSAFLGLTLAHLLAAGLCLMQALPQQLYIAFIHPEHFLQGRLNWTNNIYHVDVLYCMYYALFAIIGCEFSRVEATKGSPIARINRFWVTVLAAVFFLATPLSSFLWQRVALLQYLQFPSARLHAGALMAATWLACAWLAHYEKLLPLAPFAYRKRTVWLVVAIFACTMLGCLEATYLEPNGLNAAYVEDAHRSHIIPPPEYETKWGCADIGKVLRAFRRDTSPPQVTVAQGAAQLEAVTWLSPSQLDISARVTSQAATLLARQCYFPAWQARDEAGNALALLPDEETGQTRLELPSGLHRVRLFLTLPYEKAGLALFLACAAGCVLLMAKRPVPGAPPGLPR